MLVISYIEKPDIHQTLHIAGLYALVFFNLLFRETGVSFHI